MSCHRIAVLIAVCLATCACNYESKQAKEEPEAKIVGDWLAQQYFSPEYIDELHKMSPEGDRTLLEKQMREAVQYSVMTQRFYADGTCELLTPDGRPAKTGGRDNWTLSSDGKIVSIIEESPTSTRTTKMIDGKPVVVDTEGTKISTMKLVLSDDGQTLSDPKGESRYGMRYLKAGSDAAKKAFKPSPDLPEAPLLAESATGDDFVGTWVGQITMPKEMWEGFRASMSKREANKVKERMEQSMTLLLRQNMTFEIHVSGVEDATKGTWSLKNDGPIALLSLIRKGQSGPPIEIRLTADRDALAILDPERGVASAPVLKRRES